jgi:hypothetical protein
MNRLDAAVDHLARSIDCEHHLENELSSYHVFGEIALIHIHALKGSTLDTCDRLHISSDIETFLLSIASR